MICIIEKSIRPGGEPAQNMTSNASTTVGTLAEKICTYLWNWVRNVQEHVMFENMIFEREMEDPDTGFTYDCEFEEVLTYVPEEILEPYYDEVVSRSDLMSAMRDLYPEWRP